MEKESKLVSMSLSGDTIQRIENIKDNTKVTNRTRIVATAIKLTSELLEEVKRGSKIYIEKKDGSKEQISFIGI